MGKLPERTPLGHLGEVLGISGVVFAVLGGTAGALVGLWEAWATLNWFYALYITLAVASVVIGIVIYTDP
jgi:hypothetical protein